MDFDCLCQAENECPAEVLWMELDFDTDLYDTISRNKISVVGDSDYEFTSGSIIVNTQLELDSSEFEGDGTQFAVKIEMQGDNARIEMPIGYV